MNQLSTHFTLGEMTKSMVALRHGIDNSLDPRNDTDRETVKNLGRVCGAVLEPARLHFRRPIIPSSGYRCIELNRLLGSSDKSQHIRGQAVDFEIAGVSNLTLWKWCGESIDFDQLILEFHDEKIPSSGWVHCSYVNEDKNRRQKFKVGGSGV